MRGGGGPLFDFAAARRSDPQTSKDAAASLTEDYLTRLQQAVYATLKAHPKGLTAQEIAGHTGIDAQSITPRLRPMATKGWIEDTGERRIPFDRTRPAIVWRIKPGSASQVRHNAENDLPVSQVTIMLATQPESK